MTSDESDRRPLPGMDPAIRRRLYRRALSGYISGPDGPMQATALALAKAETARAVILVEGISDHMALETLAFRRGRDLDEEGIAIVPVGGAQAMTQYLSRFGPNGEDLRLGGLCDAAEETGFRRALSLAGLGTPQTTGDMEHLGFHLCVDDLEDELIRAVDPINVEVLFASQGDLGSFRSLQKQPEWRGRSRQAQMRRFLGAGARRKLRYARLLVEAVDLDQVPRPLDGVLAHV